MGLTFLFGVYFGDRYWVEERCEQIRSELLGDVRLSLRPTDEEIQNYINKSDDIWHLWSVVIEILDSHENCVFYLSALDVKFFEGELQNFRKKKLEEISNVPKMDENEVDTEVDIEVNSQSKLLKSPDSRPLSGYENQ